MFHMNEQKRGFRSTHFVFTGVRKSDKRGTVETQARVDHVWPSSARIKQTYIRTHRHKDETEILQHNLHKSLHFKNKPTPLSPLIV